MVSNAAIATLHQKYTKLHASQAVDTEIIGLRSNSVCDFSIVLDILVAFACLPPSWSSPSSPYLVGSLHTGQQPPRQVSSSSGWCSLASKYGLHRRHRTKDQLLHRSLPCIQPFAMRCTASGHVAARPFLDDPQVVKWFF